MTILDAPRSPRRILTGSLMRTTAVEATLFLRDRAPLFFAVAFPAVLLLAVGAAMPGFREPADDFGGQRPIDVYLPVVVAAAITFAALQTLPSYLATYRERGILRRLATTPARPSVLLAAQLVVNLAAATVAAGLAVLAGMATFGVPPPANPVGFMLAFAAGTAAMMAVGMLIAARATTARLANGLGMLLYFPMLFFAGVWTPGPVMPETVRRIAELTPLGAAARSFHDTWHGGWPALSQLGVMLGSLVVAGTLSARLFRWE